MKTLRWALAVLVVALGLTPPRAEAADDLNWGVLALDAGPDGFAGPVALALTVETLGEHVVIGLLSNDGTAYQAFGIGWGHDGSRLAAGSEAGGVALEITPGPMETYRLVFSLNAALDAGEAGGVAIFVAHARVLDGVERIGSGVTGSAAVAVRLGGGAMPLTAFRPSGDGPGVQAHHTAAGLSSQSASSDEGGAVAVGATCTGSCAGTVTAPSGQAYQWNQSRACVGVIGIGTCQQLDEHGLGLASGPGPWSFDFVGVGTTTYGVWAPIGEDWRRFTLAGA